MGFVIAFYKQILIIGLAALIIYLAYKQNQKDNAKTKVVSRYKIVDNQDYGMEFDKNGEFTGAVNSRPKHPASQELENVACTGVTANFANKEQMWATINKNEAIVNSEPTVDNCYWLGVAYHNYCTWFIRGKERTQYLEKAVYYFELAFKESKTTLSVHTNDSFEWLSQVRIAGELARLLIDQAVTRNLDKGKEYAQFVFDSIDGYDPSMISMIKYYYKTEQYEKSIQIAKEIRQRIKEDDEWRGLIDINYHIVVSLRALRDKAKREKDYKSALKWSNQIIRFISKCSDTDKKKHEKLKQLAS